MMQNTILSDIEAAAGELEMSARTLCLRAVNNGHLPDRLKDGGSVTLATVEKLMAYIERERAKRREAAE